MKRYKKIIGHFTHQHQDSLEQFIAGQRQVFEAYAKDDPTKRLVTNKEEYSSFLLERQKDKPEVEYYGFFSGHVDVVDYPKAQPGLCYITSI